VRDASFFLHEWKKLIHYEINDTDALNNKAHSCVYFDVPRSDHKKHDQKDGRVQVVDEGFELDHHRIHEEGEADILEPPLSQSIE